MGSGSAAGAVIQSRPSFWRYPSREFAVRIAGTVFAQTTALDVKSQCAGMSGTFMPLNVDRKSLKTLISSTSQELFYSDVWVTIAMLVRHGRVSLY